MYPFFNYSTTSGDNVFCEGYEWNRMRAVLTALPGNHPTKPRNDVAGPGPFYLLMATITRPPSFRHLSQAAQGRAAGAGGA